MFTKTVLVSTLLASAVLVSAAPVPQSKRCIGACQTKNESMITNLDQNTTTNTNQVETSTVQKDNGNSNTTGNSGGGNSFGNASVGSVCRRALIEARDINHAQHVFMVSRKNDHKHQGGHHQNKAQSKPKGQPQGPPPSAAPPAGNNWANINMNKSVVNTNAKNTSNVNSGNTNNNINNSKTNNANLSNNSGQIIGSGVTCRRELAEADMERRELDTGASVLAALGGQSVARSLDDSYNLLATRDLGRLADVLGVRAVGHDIDEATHYKRSIGLECSASSCDDLARREAEDLLLLHARDLGFSV